MKQDIITNIKVNDNEIRVMRINNEEYISLTDLAKYKNYEEPSDVIKKWMSNYDTIEYLGIWESISNNDFNSAEFSRIKNESAKKSFTMTPKRWCSKFNAILYVNQEGIVMVHTLIQIRLLSHSSKCKSKTKKCSIRSNILCYSSKC